MSSCHLPHQLRSSWLARLVAPLAALLACLAVPALAIDFSDAPAKPSVSWVSAQTPHSVGCEMAGQNARMLYIGQCQDGLPHGRGLLLSLAKGIEGAKAERGELYLRVPVQTMQGLQAYQARAHYLFAYQLTRWTDDGFKWSEMPTPTESKVLPQVAEFLRVWGESDPDQLAPLARQAAAQASERAQGITWAYLRARANSVQIARALQEWKSAANAERLAEAEVLYRQRWRQEYDNSFAGITNERSAADFVGTYAGNDPDRRVPKASALQASYAAATRREREARDATRAAKEAREAANPVCMAQKRSCDAMCPGLSDKGLNSPRDNCWYECSKIRCD